ncbi:MAG: flagellar biosynthetic protein FliR [Syntrophobacteraceae bacterium]
MVTFQLNSFEIGIFLAILLRISIVLFMIPVFTGTQLPSSVKVALVVALSIMIYLLPHNSIKPLPFDAIPLLMAILGEVVFGMILGLTVLMVFAAFQVAGELISFQMGFGFAQTADPQSGTQTMILSRFFQITATLIFFGMNGHHVVLRAIVESYRTIPVGGFTLTTNTFHDIVLLSGHLFIIAIRLAAPVLIALLLTHVALGIMSRFAPQLNVLAASFPLTILLGFLFLGLTVSLWGVGMEKYLERLLYVMRGLVR